MNNIHSEVTDVALWPSKASMNKVHLMKKQRVMDPNGKRAAIMIAGERLFAANGYTPTSMAEIANEADVAVGTVYRLFPDKPSLLAALHAAMEDRFIAAMQEGWTREAAYADRFGSMLDALFEEANAVHEIMPLYAMTHDMIGAADYVPGARMIEAIDAMYAEGVKAGAYRKLAKGLVAPLAHAMVEGGMRAFMARPSTKWRRKIVAEMSVLFDLAFVVK